jgi:signal transduction histidine kinase
VPAWRGRRAPAVAIAALQFVAVLPAVPAFVLPAEVVPAGGVLLAVLGVALNLVAVVLVTLDSSAVLLWAAALTAVVALYAALVSLAGLLVPSDAGRTVQTAAAIVAALLFSPLVVGLRRLTIRLVYGPRHRPGQTALHLDRRAPSAEAVEGAVAETAAALHLPGLELWEHETLLAATGARTARHGSVPLRDGYALVAALRPGERRLHRDDRAALELAGLPLLRLVRETRLLVELRTARAEAAQVREQERMMLHRDLHDGLGPLLTGAALHLDAARNLEGAASATAIDEGRAELRIAIADIRRVAHGLRPTELENGDLWTALERRGLRSEARLRFPEPRPVLAPATELAAYRIIGEALANAERHAPGAPVVVTVTSSAKALGIEVRNDLSAPVSDLRHADGIGIGSMRARAEELGGHADVGPRGREWRVSVRLPQPPGDGPDEGAAGG